MSYYIIDLVFHILLGIACAVVSVVGFYIEAWPVAIMTLIIVVCCVLLVVLDIKEIKTELWWNKQVINKKYFSDYDNEEDYD